MISVVLGASGTQRNVNVESIQMPGSLEGTRRRVLHSPKEGRSD